MSQAKTLTITFEDGVSTEYADKLVDAVKCFRGVLTAEIAPTEGSDHWALYNARLQLWGELKDVLFKKR